VEFSVNSAALTGLVDMLDRRWQDYESGRAYLKSNAHFSVTGPGILNDFSGVHQAIVDRIDAFLSTAAQGFAGPCSTAVAEANSLYRRSDQSAMSRNDAAMPAPRADALCPPAARAAPGTGAPSRADATLSGAVFADPVCPSGWFREPPDHRADHPFRFGFFDTFSPTGWGREVIWKVTGLAAHLGLIDRPYDVLAEAVEPLCGDWAGYLSCADVYDNLAGAVRDTARCVAEGAGAVDRVWTGNAADACAQGMQSFVTELDGAVAPLHRTANTYREVAEGVYRQGEAVAAVLNLILDEITELALAPETAVMEGPIELATEAFDLMKIIQKIREVAKMIGKARDMAHASMDSGLTGLNGFGVLTDRHPVPTLTPTVPILPLKGSVHAG
jgi:hypothetical protein